MLKGVRNRVAFVDLASGDIHYEVPPEELYLKYLGGYGLGAHYLFERQAPGADPLGPGNTLVFATGLLTGTPAITGSRFQVCGRSPKTGGFGDANCGGRFGPALKEAGLDALVITGAAAVPVYLSVADGDVVVRDAEAYWGLGASEAEDRLAEVHGRKASFAVIGPAGERVSLLACIVHDKGRVAGRSGLGAVMGSKRLKAIVAEPSGGELPLADGPAFDALRKELMARHCSEGNPAWEELHEFGTPASLIPLTEIGDTPVRNWAGWTDHFPAYARLGGEAVKRLRTRRYACWRCPIACGAHVEVKTGAYAGSGHQPEYETLAAFGNLCLNDDLEAICHLNNICNDAGIDTISTGATVAFALECYERGIITKSDTDGLEMRWGDSAAIVAVTEQIASGWGFGGRVLGDGVRAAVALLGPEAESCANDCGGEELGMHDPRYFPGIATSYAADATPGRHTQGGAWYVESSFMPEDFAAPAINDRYIYGGKGEAHRRLSNLQHVINAAGLCQFTLLMIPAAALPEYVRLATGASLSIDDLLDVGERIANLRIAFNLREGVSPRTAFRLPPRVLGRPPLEGGEVAGVTVDHELQVRDYYTAMGWDPESGVPTDETLSRLGLGFVVQALHMSSGFAPEEWGTREQ